MGYLFPVLGVLFALPIRQWLKKLNLDQKVQRRVGCIGMLSTLVTFIAGGIVLAHFKVFTQTISFPVLCFLVPVGTAWLVFGDMLMQSFQNRSS